MTATEPTRCPTDERLSAFIAGRLTAAETDQLAQHLDACADCQQRLAALDNSSPSVDSWAAAGGAVPFAEESQCGRVVEDLAARRHGAAGVGSPVAAAPKQLGEYELLERLGEGGMGAVYKARHRGLETLVAVKVLHPQRQADEVTLERFQREMIAIGKLDHPQIVRAIDAGEDQGIHYLVMEFVDGVDLARVVQRCGSLPLADACEVIRQTALGLAYVHRQGRVHRDVKPSNLMLANDGTVKILDLGLAQVAEYTIEEGGGVADDLLGGSSKADLTRTHQVMGTLEYMAPEQARDSRRVDYRADIYSLGATFYKLLTGHSPFATSGNITAMSQVLAHVQAPAPPVRNYRPDVPADVAILLERMLSKSPHERPDSADEIAAALAPHCRTAALRPLLETTTIRSERSTDDRLAATVVELPPVRVADHGRRPFPWLAAAVVLGLLAVVMGCMVGLAVWTMQPSSGFVVVTAESDETTEALQSEPVFLVRRDNNLRMLLQTGRRRLPAGDYVIETEADSALVFSPNRFTLGRNQQLVLQARLASLGELSASVEPEVAEVVPQLTPSGPSVDLIPLLDPVRDIRGDDWRIVDGALVSDASKNSMLHFPYRPPATYRLEMTAERLQNDESLNIGLVAGDDPLIITVDGYPYAGSYSGVYRVDDRNPTQQPSRDTHRGRVLPLNRPVQLVATVQYAAGRAAVQLDADGRRIFSWRGTANRTGTSPLMQPNEPSALCLGNHTAAIRLSNVRLVPLKGEGEPIVFADPADDPQRAAAERAIWKGGSVTLLADESTPRAQLEASPLLANMELARRFEGHTKPVKSVVVSHDGTLAASGSGWPTGDKTVRIWDVASGETIRVLEIGERVMALAFTPDDKRLLVGGANALPLSVWDVQSGSMIQKLDTGDATYVEEVAISPDGSKLIAVLGGTGRLLAWNEQLEPLPHIRDTASSIAITPDSQFMAGGRADGSIDVFSLDTGEVVRSLAGPTFNGNATLAYTVAASPDGQWLVAGYKEGKLRVWDWASGSVLHDVRTQATGHESLAFTHDSRYVIAAGMPGMVSVVEVASGYVIATTPKTVGDGWSVAMMPDGRSVLSGGGVHWSDGWKPTGDFALRIWQLPEDFERLAAEAADRKPPRYVVEAQRFSEIPDQPKIVSIDLEGSQWLRDEDLAYFAGLDTLESLHLAGAPISEAGLEALGSQPNLTELKLARTGVRRLLESFGERYPRLEKLELQQTPLVELPSGSFATLGQSLSTLNLAGTGIGDPEMEMLALLENLRELDLSQTGVSAAGLAALPPMPRLESLDLSGTRIESTELFTVDRFPQLARLNLVGAELSREWIEQLRTSMPNAEITSSFGAIDLISLIDVERDADRTWNANNRWSKTAGLLKTSERSRLALPVLLPMEFDLTMTATREAAGNAPIFGFSLPDGTQFAIGFDHEPAKGAFTILHGVDNVIQMDSTVKTQGETFPAGLTQPVRIKISVRVAEDSIDIRALRDGEEVLAWQGLRSRLGFNNAWWKGPDFSRPWMSQYDGTLAISELTLTPVSGQVDLPTFGPSYAEPDREVAEWVLEHDGSIQIRLADGEPMTRLTAGDELPNQPFWLVQFDVRKLHLELPTDWLAKVGRLKRLDWIWIADATFDNADLAPLANHRTLRGIAAWNASMDDVGMKHLATIRGLQNLEFGNSAVTDKGVSYFEGHPSIVNFGAGARALTDRSLEIAATMPMLNRIVLFQTQITGAGLAKLQGKESLQKLEIHQCAQLMASDLAHVAAMPNLTELDAGHNRFGPDACLPLAGMIGLEMLHLDSNPIGDEGLLRLTNLRSLRVLKIARTNTTDAGMATIGNFTRLEHLGLIGNRGVTDASVPTIARLSQLRELSIEGTNISPGGFQSLRQSLPRCQISYDPTMRDEKLDLTGRGVTDETLPLALEGRSPTHLVLEGEGITDASLAIVAEIPGLTRLDIWNASITNEGLEKLVDVETLQRLDLWNMPSITGDATEHIAKISQLKTFIFKGTGIHGPGLERLHNRGITGVSLGNTQLDSEMFRKYVVPFGSLGTLDLAGCRIADDDVRVIAEEMELTDFLHLGFIPTVTGPGLKYVLDMPRLSKLNLSGSHWDDEALSNLAGATQLRGLNLNRTMVGEGSIETLATLTGLRELSLSDTQFTAEGIERLKERLPGVLVTATHLTKPYDVYPPPNAERVGGNGWKPSWSGDGKEIVYGLPGAKGLAIVSLESGETRPLRERAKDAAWSTRGDWIAYVGEPFHNAYKKEGVGIIKPDGSDARSIGDGLYPFWIGGGKTLVYYDRPTKGLMSLAIDSLGDAESPATEPFYADAPSFYFDATPDGRYLAYAAKGTLYVVERETREEIFTREFQGLTAGGLPKFSPEGRYLAFAPFGGEEGGVWLIDWRSGEARQVAKGNYNSPSWSPDGLRLAFDFRRGGDVIDNPEIWVMPLDGNLPAGEAK